MNALSLMVLCTLLLSTQFAVKNAISNEGKETDGVDGELMLTLDDINEKIANGEIKLLNNTDSTAVCVLNVENDVNNNNVDDNNNVDSCVCGNGDPGDCNLCRSICYNLGRLFYCCYQNYCCCQDSIFCLPPCIGHCC